MVRSYGTGQYSASAATNEAHVLATPWSYKADGTRRLVVWSHSAGGQAVEPFITSNNALPHVQAIVDALSLPLISFDASPPSGGLEQHWGNDTAQSRLTDAISFAQARLNAEVDRVIVLGISMGGMLSLNWARANPAKVAAIAVMYPATNLQAIHDGTGGAAAGGATSTEAAYGGSLTTFNAAVAAHDPSQHASAYAALGVPMKMWYSDSDTTVGTANQAAFATAIGSSLQTTVLQGAGHADMTKIDPLALQQFVKGAM